MISLSATRAAAVATAIMLLSLTPGHGTTVVPPTFEEMVDRADLVFAGKVVRSHAVWRTSGQERVIFTQVEFETHEVLKGKAGKSVTLEFLGGAIGDVKLEVAEVPRFGVGERVLLFVEGNGVQFCPLVGVFHGKFGLRNDEKSGRELVLMHDGQPLRDIGAIGRGGNAGSGSKQTRSATPTEGEAISVGDFKERIRSRLAKKVAQE